MLPGKSHAGDGANSFQNLILSKRTNFGEKSGPIPLQHINNSFDMFQSHRSESRLKNDLVSGKLAQRVQSFSLIQNNSKPNEQRPRVNTIASISRGASPPGKAGLNETGFR